VWDRNSGYGRVGRLLKETSGHINEWVIVKQVNEEKRGDLKGLTVGEKKGLKGEHGDPTGSWHTATSTGVVEWNDWGIVCLTVSRV